jgi:hypothetical protein
VWGDSTQSPRDRLLELQEKTGGNTVIFPNESPVGLDTAYHRAGLVLFSYGYAENPDLISAWLEALNWAEIQRVHESADPTLSPVALVYSDIADKNQTLFSPAFLRREFFPRVRKLIDAWHSHGIKVIYHSDGNLWRVLDDLRDTGTNGLNPLEPLSHMQAERVHRAYPEWILMGGVDASRLLPYGTEAEVRAAVRELLDGPGRAAKLWIGSSTEIHPAVPLRNVLVMWDEIEASGYLS